MKKTVLLTEKWNKELTHPDFRPLGSTNKALMAVILENTNKEVVAINEKTENADIATFTTIIVPMARRVYPELLANELVGVQPMKSPTEYLYALVYNYTGSSDNGLSSSSAPSQILSIGEKKEVGDNITGSVTGAVGEVIYAENGGLTVLVSLENDTVFNDEDENVLATWSNEAQFQRVLKDYSGPVDTATAEDMGSDIQETGFSIKRKLAEAKSRKLKGKYSLEMFHDLKVVHGDLDAEKELMQLMSQELSFGIDREVVERINDTSNPGSDVTVSSYDGRWEIEKYRSLGITIADRARQVGQLIRVGAANKLLVSPKVSIALDSLTGFTASNVQQGTIDAVNSGVRPVVGTFDRRYSVSVDNFTYGKDEYINAFHKGENNKDAMIFLAPFVGASFIKTQDPDSGQPAVIISSRYAVIENPLNPENYGNKFSVSFKDTALGENK